MKKIIAYVHTHWDREWYREFEEFRLRLIEVLNDIILKLQKGELPVFYFDGQISAVEDYLEIYPEKVDVIKKLIAEKKLFVGPFYCSADQFLTSGESLLRNLYFGIKKSKELGNKEFLAYLSDTFGHCVSMSEILKAANLDKAVLWRGLGDLNADLLWQDIKTTYLIQGYFNDFLSSDMDFDKKADALKRYIDKIAAKSGEYVLLPIGADHLKACDNLKKQIEMLNKKYKNEYEIVISEPFEYFKNIKDEDRTTVSGEFLNNSLNFILQGVYSSRNDIKQANARCERKLNDAEMFDAVNSTFYGKTSRQKQLDYAYKTLIKNHAHDSIYGCNTDKVNREVLTRYEKVEEIADGVKKRCERDLKTEKGFSAINLSNNDFKGVATIWSDKKLPSNLKAVLLEKKRGFSDDILYNTAKIPVTEDYTDICKYAVKLKNVDAFSLKNITKHDIADASDIKVGKHFIENQNLVIEIKNNQINVTDKKNHLIYHDFIKITDVGDVGDSYNFAPVKNDKKVVAKIKSVKIEGKKLFAKAIVDFEIKIPETSTDKRRSLIAPRHKIQMTILLKSDSDFAEFKTDYVNKSENHKLQVAFGLKNPIVETISEDLTKTVKRVFDPDYDLNDKIPAPRGFELKTNTMPINCFVWCQGVGVISDGLHEVEICKNDLALTLLRSTGIISNPKNPSRGTPAGPPIETPELQMLGKYSAEFAISFTDSADDLYKVCDEYFSAPILVQSNMPSKQFVTSDNKKIKVSVIKKSDKDELVLRLINASDEREACTIKCGNKLPVETDLTEEKNIPTNGILYFNPHEIKTVKMK